MSDSTAFTEACDFIMPLGKHKGQRLARIGSNTEGLLYLDWMVDAPWVRPELKGKLETYLKHPAVALQLSAALED